MYMGEKLKFQGCVDFVCRDTEKKVTELRACHLEMFYGWDITSYLSNTKEINRVQLLEQRGIKIFQNDVRHTKIELD